MSTSSPVRAAPASRHEQFVRNQLHQARQRIRVLDTTASLLGLAILTLAYGLATVVADRAWELPALARQLALGGYIALAALYLGYTLVRPLCRRVNPYYAARHMEETLPDAKNSIINWLDLHQQPLPASIQAAVSHKAARDLAEADLETAFSARRNLWLTAIFFGFCLGMFAQMVIGGPQFFSLLRRAFAPFTERRIATRTQIQLLRPEHGDLTVAVGRAVSFAVEVRGRVPSPSKPDAVRLLYRYHAEDPYEEQRLEPGDQPGEWAIILPAYQVHNGLWYKIAGGDTATPEYRVSVRSTPLLTDFEATYHYRPYLGWKDQTTRDPNLKALRGTEVTLIARANRAVRSGQLELIEQRRSIAAEPVAEEPQAMRFRWVPDQNGTYRISFTSDEDERNSDPLPFEIKVLPDLVPRVTLTQPGQDVTLPLNAKLNLRGSAHDDFGLSGLTLRMQVSDKEVFAPLPYPKGGLKPSSDGSYPRNLDYQETIALDQLTHDRQKLKAGTVLEYWLEAADHCDYPPPGPNIGRSDKFKVTLTEAVAEKPQEQKPEQKAQSKQQPAKQDKPNESQQDQRSEAQQGPDKQKNTENQPGQQKNDPAEGGAGKSEPQRSERSGEGDASSEPQTEQEKQLEQQRKRLEDALKEVENEKQQQGQQQKKDDASKGEQSKDGEKSPSSQSGNGGQQGQQGSSSQKTDQQGQQQQGDPKPQEQSAGQKQESNKPDTQGGEGNRSTKADSQNKPGQEPKEQDGQGSSKDENPAKTDASKTQGQQNQAQQKQGQEGKDAGSSSDKASAKPQAANGGGQPQTGNPDKKSEQQPGKDAGSAKDKSPQSGKPEPQPGQAGQGEQTSSDSANKPANDKGPAGSPSGQDKEKGAGKQNLSQPDKQPASGSADSPKANQDKAGTNQQKSQQKSGADSQAGKIEPKTDDSAGPREEMKDRQVPQAKGKEGQSKNPADQQGSKDAANDPSKDQQAGKPEQAKPDRESSGDRQSQNIDRAVKEMAEKLKNADPKTRQQMLDKLREAAKDPKAKETLEKMLKEASEGADKQPSSRPGDDQPADPLSPKTQRKETGKPVEPGASAGTTTGEKQVPKPGDKGDENGSPQSQPRQGTPPKGEGAKSDAKPEKGQNNDSKGEGSSARKDGRPEPGQPGNNPGQGSEGNRDGTSSSAAEQPEQLTVNPRYQKRAGELQLEDFKKRITKDVLEKANMTPEEYAKFNEAYKEMLQRRQQEAAAKEDKLADPKRSGGNLSNLGPRRVQGGPQKEATQGGTQRRAPPEYSGKYNEFTEKLSNLKRDKDR